MLKTARATFVVLILAVAMLLAGPLTASALTGKPEDVAIAMTQTSNQEFLRDFENMVMQSVVSGSAGPRSIGTN